MQVSSSMQFWGCRHLQDLQVAHAPFVRVVDAFREVAAGDQLHDQARAGRVAQARPVHPHLRAAPEGDVRLAMHWAAAAHGQCCSCAIGTTSHVQDQAVERGCLIDSRLRFMPH